MAAQVHGNDAAVSGEVLDLWREIRVVAHPAMDEQPRPLAGAGFLVPEADAIAIECGYALLACCLPQALVERNQRNCHTPSEPKVAGVVGAETLLQRELDDADVTDGVQFDVHGKSVGQRVENVIRVFGILPDFCPGNAGELVKKKRRGMHLGIFQERQRQLPFRFLERNSRDEGSIRDFSGNRDPLGVSARILRAY